MLLILFNLLPELDSLKLFGILSDWIESSDFKINYSVLFVVNNSQITKIYPQKVNLFQLSYLMLVFTLMTSQIEL